MSLDRRTIVAAALELLDESGVEGVSTRKLADKLGVKGPSLYWHFHNKNELLAEMSGEMLAQALPAPDLESGDFEWSAWLAEGARGIRRQALSRRDGAILLAKARPNDGLPDSRARSLMVTTLARSGLSEDDSRMAMLALGRFAIGWVLYEQTAAPRPTLHGGDEGFEFGLQTFIAGLRVRIAKGG